MCLLASWVKRYHLDNDKLWKQIIDHKYRVKNPNLFYCLTNGASPFWKGVLWAAKAAKMGFQWKIGNGRNVMFWEDQWFGTSSLAIQFWELYCLANEQFKTVADLWDGQNLKITFRRCFDHKLMIQWYELVQIVNSIQFSGEADALIWKFESNGVFTVKSMYAVINFKGVLPVYVHFVWDIKVPPKIHFFLWLLAHRKNLTRDNLVKRQNVDDLTCLFCNELETCDHLFFECAVATAIWSEIRRILKIHNAVINFDVIAGLWKNNKQNALANVVSAAVLWSIWLTRNDMCFNRSLWMGMQVLWRRLAFNLAQWIILLAGEEKRRAQQVIMELEALMRAPQLLLWREPG
jgi:hypothetical protein